jgi:preprotein translocase subunit SecG
MLLESISIVVILIASILLILAVLVQSPKSGMAANFGAANQVMGVRESANILEKTSWWLAGIIAALSIIISINAGEGTVVNNFADDLNATQSTVVTEEGMPNEAAEMATETVAAEATEAAQN